MARIGGRATWIAVPAGVACLAVVGVLAWLSLPMVPATVAWLGDAATGRLGHPAEAAAADVPDEADATPADCRDLYSDALWASLTSTSDALLSQDAAAPRTTATTFAQALGPAISLTCTWRAGDAVISTSLGQVAVDAGAIAEAALPSEGFACADVGTRVRCVKAADDTVETIEVGGGRWLSSLQTSWAPERYAARVAERVFAG